MEPNFSHVTFRPASNLSLYPPMIRLHYQSTTTRGRTFEYVRYGLMTDCMPATFLKSASFFIVDSHSLSLRTASCAQFEQRKDAMTQNHIVAEEAKRLHLHFSNWRDSRG